MSTNRFVRIIEALTRHDVRFIIVGGIAAVLQRVPVITEDFDIVHDRSSDNVARLLRALSDLDAIYRDDPRNLRPSASHLVGTGHQLLETHGVHFDVLGTIDPDLGYSDLIADSELVEVAGHEVRVLTLERLIAHKRDLSRPKDKLMLLHLEATLEERQKLRRGKH